MSSFAPPQRPSSLDPTPPGREAATGFIAYVVLVAWAVFSPSLVDLLLRTTAGYRHLHAIADLLTVAPYLCVAVVLALGATTRPRGLPGAGLVALAALVSLATAELVFRQTVGADAVTIHRWGLWVALMVVVAGWGVAFRDGRQWWWMLPVAPLLHEALLTLVSHAVPVGSALELRVRDGIVAPLALVIAIALGALLDEVERTRASRPPTR